MMRTMNATALVRAPLGPHAKAWVEKSNAESAWIPKCFRCLERQKAYDNMVSLLQTSNVLGKLLGTKTASVKPIGPRPEVSQAKWYVNFWTEFLIDHSVERAICAECAIPFHKERMRDAERWAGLPGRHKEQKVGFFLIKGEENQFGMMQALKGEMWHYEPKLRRLIQDYPKKK